MNEFRADLHCHSTCSDGTLSPTEIVCLASKINLKGLSITDHDTIGAYPEALAAAETYQIPLISGAEFSAVYDQTNIHILAYSFSLDSQIIHDFCDNHCLRRTSRNRAILDLLTSHGMPIGEEELKTCTPHSIIGRPHIALLMVKKGYVSSLQQAFHLYIGEGKPCYHPGTKVSVEETIDIIHQANGLAIIAHPHLIQNVKVVRDLIELDFDGLEGYYARFNNNQNERWLKIAARKKWLITGGSDFHGDIKPNLPLGASWVNDEVFSILLNHFKKNQTSSQ